MKIEYLYYKLGDQAGCCSLILYIHAPVRTSYVHVRMCITLQDPGIGAGAL